MNRTVRFRQLFLLAASWMLLHPGAVRSRAMALPLCSDVCGSDAACAEACIDDSGFETTCADYNGGQSNGECRADDCAYVCGSGVSCDTPCGSDSSCGGYNGGEGNGECYGRCGDATCNGPETAATCPADCAAGGGCSPSPCCGDGICNGGETHTNCAGDCPEGSGTCGDGVCDANEVGGAGTGSENNCDPDRDPTCHYCPEDCGTCNPAFCWPQVCGSEAWKCGPCSSCSECGGDSYCADDGTCEAGFGRCDIDGQCSAEFCVQACEICAPFGAR